MIHLFYPGKGGETEKGVIWWAGRRCQIIDGFKAYGSVTKRRLDFWGAINSGIFGVLEHWSDGVMTQGTFFYNTPTELFLKLLKFPFYCL